MRIHHLALRTADLPRLERFYVETLGLAVMRRDGERSVWLDAGGSIVMLERADASEPAPPAGSMELLAFAAAREAIAEQAARLPVEARTASTIYFRDPDGRRVALSAYPATL